MALPEQLPEPPDDFETSSGRPSWLVGAEEGVASELEGLERSEVKLVRPMAPTPLPTPPAAASAAATPATPAVVPIAPVAPATPAAPPRPVAWTAAGNSVPRLTQVPEPPRRAPEPPVEDLEPVSDPIGDPLSEREPPAGALSVRATAPQAAYRPTLDEPWWLVIGERVGGDRRIQIGIAAVLVIALAFVFWPRGGHGISVHDLLRNPEKWEGQSVSVSGRVGEVFPLGSGFVFNLHQGRDTIVVFTRGAEPSQHAHVSVTGEVSAGYLDGRARLAILETPQAPPPSTP